MPRPPRADEAGGLYHALNRGNGRQEIFHKLEDYAAFERILAEGLAAYDVRLLCFVLMPNHWHLILQPHVDGELSRFMRWITATHTMRYRAHYHTAGEGHVYQGRFKSFPIQDDAHFLMVCRYVEGKQRVLTPFPLSSRERYARFVAELATQMSRSHHDVGPSVLDADLPVAELI